MGLPLATGGFDRCLMAGLLQFSSQRSSRHLNPVSLQLRAHRAVIEQIVTSSLWAKYLSKFRRTTGSTNVKLKVIGLGMRASATIHLYVELCFPSQNFHLHSGSNLIAV